MTLAESRKGPIPHPLGLIPVAPSDYNAIVQIPEVFGHPFQSNPGIRYDALLQSQHAYSRLLDPHCESLEKPGVAPDQGIASAHVLPTTNERSVLIN